jgi:hypothetical protein
MGVSRALIRKKVQRSAFSGNQRLKSRLSEIISQITALLALAKLSFEARRVRYSPTSVLSLIRLTSKKKSSEFNLNSSVKSSTQN